MSKFYPLHIDQYLEMNTLLKESELRVCLYLMASDPFCDRKLEIETAVIAEQLGLTRRSIQKALNRLDELGFIEWKVTRQSIIGKWRTQDRQANSDSPNIKPVANTDSPKRTQDRQSEPRFAETNSGSPTSSENQSEQGFQNPHTIKTNKTINTLQISEIGDEISEKNFEVKRQDSGFEIDKISEPSDKIAEPENSEFEIHKIPESKRRNSEVENSSLRSTLAILKPKIQNSVIRDPETEPEVSDQEMRRRVEIFDQETEQGDTLTDLKARSERTFPVKSDQIGDGKISPPSDIELFAFVKHEFECQGRQMRNPEIYVKTAINRERSEWVKRWYSKKREAVPVETWKPTPFARPDPEVAGKAIAEAKAMLIKRNLYRTTTEKTNNFRQPLKASQVGIESLCEEAICLTP